MNGIILVGVDRSETAFKAAQTAADLASDMGYALHVITAYDSSDVSPPNVSYTRDTQQISSEIKTHDDALTRQVTTAQETAESVAAKLRSEFSDLTVVPQAAEGAPARAIIATASELNADIVVVGNKRVQSAARILGTIADAVSKEVKCDVYIANTHQR